MALVKRYLPFKCLPVIAALNLYATLYGIEKSFKIRRHKDL